jgi:hypothetical protein
MSNTAAPSVHRPAAMALGLVRLGAQLLPRPERQRYRREFVADLRHLDRTHQLSYATGVFCTAWALRQQLTKEPTMNDTTTTPTIPLLCRLNLHHHYHYAYTEDGRRYSRCAQCGKDDPHLGSQGPIG